MIYVDVVKFHFNLLFTAPATSGIVVVWRLS
jgi:hypothetical protein